MMFIQHLPDEDQSQSLPVGFGREEGGEQFGCCLLVDTLPGIGDLHAGRIGVCLDVDASLLPDGFHGVLDDVHQDLLEQCGI